MGGIPPLQGQLDEQVHKVIVGTAAIPQTIWESSIWSWEDDDSYMLPDPGIPLVYSLHYGQ